MIHVHTDRLEHFSRVASLPPFSVRFANFVDNHWAVLHPQIGVGMCPIVTFQGDEGEAREALTPIVQALQEGNAAFALELAIAWRDGDKSYGPKA